MSVHSISRVMCVAGYRHDIGDGLCLPRLVTSEMVPGSVPSGRWARVRCGPTARRTKAGLRPPRNPDGSRTTFVDWCETWLGKSEQTAAER